MKEVILLKNGEIALKGLNRHAFEDRLIKNARRKLMPVGEFHFKKAQSTIYVEPQSDDYDLDEAVDRLQKVFGIAALTRACVVEKDFELICRTAAEYLKEELEALGMEAILTRSDERALAEGKKADMAARGKIMNGEGVDLVVSVHMNKFTDPSVHGPMAFYMKGSAEGEKLAKTVIDSITDELGAPRRIANPGDYYVIRESMPVSVLVECGFLSNSGDEALLQQEQHQKKLAHAIARGIFSYFEGDLGRKPLD